MAEHDLRWKLAQLAERIEGVIHVTFLTTDGLLIDGVGLEEAEQDLLSATAAGLLSLGRSYATQTSGVRHVQTLTLELPDRMLLVAAAGDNAVLVVGSTLEADMGVVASEMSRLVA